MGHHIEAAFSGSECRGLIHSAVAAIAETATATSNKRGCATSPRVVRSNIKQACGHWAMDKISVLVKGGAFDKYRISRPPAGPIPIAHRDGPSKLLRTRINGTTITRTVRFTQCARSISVIEATAAAKPLL